MPTAEWSELFSARVGWFGAPVCRAGMCRVVPARETGATSCGGSLQAGCNGVAVCRRFVSGGEAARQRERRWF
jgi:hypothetical protein